MKRLEAILHNISALTYRQPLKVTACIRYHSGATFPICPRCHISLDREYQSYCDRCGQALDWQRFESARIIIK